MKKLIKALILKIFLFGACMSLQGFITEKSSFAQDIGAHVPWITVEAESSDTNGRLLEGFAERSEVTYEASGRACIELNKEGDFLKFVSEVEADRITIRYSIPEGSKSIIGLLVNNELKKVISLSSERIWKKKADYPGGRFRFFDEVIIDADVKPGDEIQLTKKDGAGMSASIIDFIDLELRPDPISKPSGNWLDVTDYGADGKDEADDTQAIQHCIEAALTGARNVWMPPGNYYINNQINVSRGITISGAGMWHSVIRKNIPARSNKRAFQMADSTTISNLRIDDIQGNVRINGDEGIRFSRSSMVIIDGVWVSNTFGAGILGANANNVQIKNCRITGTYADAIHIARQSYNILAENNLVRNSGDDGLAIVTYASKGCHHVTFRMNTVWFNYSGRGITLIGGDYNVLENNLIIDGARAGILIAAETYNNQITPYVTNFLVQNNRIIRCGDIVSSNRHGISIWGNIESSPLSGKVIFNEIISPVTHGISLHNWVPKEVYIQNNAIGKTRTGYEPIYTNDLKAGFSPVLRENTEQAELE